MKHPRIITPYRARRLGVHRGKAVANFPVIIRQEWLADDLDIREDEVVVRVISTSAQDAAQHVWDEVAHKVCRPTQITVAGPKGGVAAHRFIGWEMMIAANLNRTRPVAIQLPLFAGA